MEKQVGYVPTDACQLWGDGVPQTRLAPRGLEVMRPLLRPGDSDGPKNWVLNLASLRNPLASFKRC